MSNSVPAQQVLKDLYDSLKRINNLSVEQIATVLGYKSKQSVYNLFSSNRYVPIKVATKLYQEYGYNVDYLTAGKGFLLQATEDIVSNRNITTSMYLILKGCFRDLVTYWRNPKARELLDTFNLLEQYYFYKEPQTDYLPFVKLIEKINLIREEIAADSTN